MQTDSLLNRVLPGIQGSLMIRGQGFKYVYVRYAQGDEYLCHLTEEPGETHNLIGDAKCRTRCKELSAELTAWLRRTTWPG